MEEFILFVGPFAVFQSNCLDWLFDALKDAWHLFTFHSFGGSYICVCEVPLFLVGKNIQNCGQETASNDEFLLQNLEEI